MATKPNLCTLLVVGRPILAQFGKVGGGSTSKHENKHTHKYKNSLKQPNLKQPETNDTCSAILAPHQKTAIFSRQFRAPEMARPFRASTKPSHFGSAKSRSRDLASLNSTADAAAHFASAVGGVPALLVFMLAAFVARAVGLVRWFRQVSGGFGRVLGRGRFWVFLGGGWSGLNFLPTKGLFMKQLEVKKLNFWKGSRKQPRFGGFGTGDGAVGFLGGGGTDSGFTCGCVVAVRRFGGFGMGPWVFLGVRGPRKGGARILGKPCGLVPFGRFRKESQKGESTILEHPAHFPGGLRIHIFAGSQACLGSVLSSPKAASPQGRSTQVGQAFLFPGSGPIRFTKPERCLPSQRLRSGHASP